MPLLAPILPIEIDECPWGEDKYAVVSFIRRIADYPPPACSSCFTLDLNLKGLQFLGNMWAEVLAVDTTLEKAHQIFDEAIKKPKWPGWVILVCESDGYELRRQNYPFSSFRQPL